MHVPNTQSMHGPMPHPFDFAVYGGLTVHERVYMVHRVIYGLLLQYVALLLWSTCAIRVIEWSGMIQERIGWSGDVPTRFQLDLHNLHYDRCQSDGQELFWVKPELFKIHDSVLDAV